MLIILFLVSHFKFLFIPCGRLCWLPVSFLLHVKYTLSHRIVANFATTRSPILLYQLLLVLDRRSCASNNLFLSARSPILSYRQP